MIQYYLQEILKSKDPVILNRAEEIKDLVELDGRLESKGTHDDSGQMVQLKLNRVARLKELKQINELCRLQGTTKF